MLINTQATSSSKLAQKNDPQSTPADSDSADSLFEEVATVTFEKPFTLNDLANSLVKNADGSYAFKFSEDSGAKVEHKDS